MRNLPDPTEINEHNNQLLALNIWEDVVSSMSQYTNDSYLSKFNPPEELLRQIRPVAAAFTMLHYTPIPMTKEIYKSQLYTLFNFSILCGIQMYVKQRAILKNHAPYVLQTNNNKIREAKEIVMKQLTEGIRVFPPINQTMDIILQHLITPRRVERLPLKNLEFDNQKFDKFMPVTILWGYLFAREIILDISNL